MLLRLDFGIGALCVGRCLGINNWLHVPLLGATVKCLALSAPCSVTTQTHLLMVCCSIVNEIEWWLTISTNEGVYHLISYCAGKIATFLSLNCSLQNQPSRSYAATTVLLTFSHLKDARSKSKYETFHHQFCPWAHKLVFLLALCIPIFNQLVLLYANYIHIMFNHLFILVYCIFVSTFVGPLCLCFLYLLLLQ